MAAGSTKVLVATLTLSNPEINETIRRTTGILQVFSDQVAASESQFGAVGMCVVSDAAVTAGVASLPGLITDRNDNLWFLWTPFLQSFFVATAVGTQARLGALYAMESKAMRRVQEGQQVAIIAETASSSDGTTVNIALSVYGTRTARV